MLGTRNFEVTRRNGGGPLHPHEQQILEAIFHSRSGPLPKVTLNRARNRLTRRWRQVAKTFEAELASAGLLDDTRRALRRRYIVTAIGCLALAAIAAFPAILSIGRFGPWTLLVPGAFVALALISLIIGATVTKLSNEGVRRAHLWRNYRRRLRLIATGRQPECTRKVLSDRACGPGPRDHCPSRDAVASAEGCAASACLDRGHPVKGYRPGTPGVRLRYPSEPAQNIRKDGRSGVTRSDRPDAKDRDLT